MPEHSPPPTGSYHTDRNAKKKKKNINFIQLVVQKQHM